MMEPNKADSDVGAENARPDSLPARSRSADAPIPLALCVTELEVGGAERCLVELATRLDRREFAPLMISLGPRPADGTDVGARAADNRVAGAGQLVEQLERARVPVTFLNARSIFEAPRTVAALAGLFWREKPRVVQTFLHHANILGAVAARLAGVGPILSGVRVAERDARSRLAMLRGVDRWIARHVCVSESVADFLAVEGRLPRPKLQVIPNGVDLDRLRNLPACDRESLGLAPGRRLIACVGRLDRQKGVDRLLASAPQFLAALPDHDLVIAGQGPERKRLDRLARQSGFGTRIHLVGWRADAATILAAADVVVSLSRWEGMSNVLLETMALSRPIVATRVEGVAELLGPGEGEQTVAEERLAEAPAKIVAICRNTSLQKALGEANRARAEREFSMAAMVDRYARLYREHAARVHSTR